MIKIVWSALFYYFMIIDFKINKAIFIYSVQALHGCRQPVVPSCPTTIGHGQLPLLKKAEVCRLCCFSKLLHPKGAEEEGTTSSPHGPYGVGNTCVTVENTDTSKVERWSNVLKFSLVQMRVCNSAL